MVMSVCEVASSVVGYPMNAQDRSALTWTLSCKSDQDRPRVIFTFETREIRESLGWFRSFFRVRPGEVW